MGGARRRIKVYTKVYDGDERRGTTVRRSGIPTRRTNPERRTTAWHMEAPAPGMTGLPSPVSLYRELRKEDIERWNDVPPKYKYRQYDCNNLREYLRFVRNIFRHGGRFPQPFKRGYETVFPHQRKITITNPDNTQKKQLILVEQFEAREKGDVIIGFDLSTQKFYIATIRRQNLAGRRDRPDRRLNKDVHIKPIND